MTTKTPVMSTLEPVIEGGHVPELNPGPYEQIYLSYAEGTAEEGAVTVRQGPSPGLSFVLRQKMYKLSGEEEGVYQAVFENLFTDVGALFAWPTPPTPDYEDATPVKQVTINGATRAKWTFSDGSTLEAPGPGIIHLIPLEDGSFQMQVSVAAVITNGTGRFAGAVGKQTALGSSWLPSVPDLKPGLTFGGKTAFWFKVILKKDQKPGALPPAPEGPASPPPSIVPSPGFSEATLAQILQGGHVSELVPGPYEEIFVRWAAGTAEEGAVTVRQGAAPGLSFVLIQKMYKLDGEEDGTYQAVFENLFTDVGELFQWPPPPSSDYVNPTPVEPIKVNGATRAKWTFGDGSTLEAPGPGIINLVPLADGSFQMQVSVAAVVTTGTGRFAGAVGKQTALGSSWLPSVPDLKPGLTFGGSTAFWFKVILKEDQKPLELPPAFQEIGKLFPPGVDPQTYRTGDADYLVNRAAYLNLFSLPNPEKPDVPVYFPGAPRTPENFIGFDVYEDSHRFQVTVDPPGTVGLAARNGYGQVAASIAVKMRVIPDDFVAGPGIEPPPTRLDPSRSQRFVLIDANVSVRDTDSGFSGFGVGRTFPDPGDPSRVDLGATIDLAGTGPELDGLPAVGVANGYIAPPEGIAFNMLLRVVNYSGSLITTRTLSKVDPVVPQPDPGSTYFTFRGQGKEIAEFLFSPAGQPLGIQQTEDLQIVFLDFDVGRNGRIRSKTTLGPVVGELLTRLEFNPFDPSQPGSAAAPVPFTTHQSAIIFYDQRGKKLGTVSPNITDGRAFVNPLPGFPMPSYRMGGVASFAGGTGLFEGARGMMTVNGNNSVFPFVLSNLYVFRFADPEGKYRQAVAAACRRPAETDPGGPSVTLNLSNTTQGPPWPPTEVADKDGNFPLVGGLLMTEVEGRVMLVPNFDPSSGKLNGLLISKDTVPPLKDGREDFTEPASAPYKVLRELDLTPGSKDMKTELFSHSCGPWEPSKKYDFGGGHPRIPRQGESKYNLNMLPQPIRGLAPEDFREPAFHVAERPLHQATAWSAGPADIPPDVPIGVPVSSRRVEQIPVPDWRHREPITLERYLGAKGRVTITLTRPEGNRFTAARFDFSFQDLFPRSLFGLRAVRPSTSFTSPTSPEFRYPDPLALPNTFVTTETGTATFSIEISNPFPPFAFPAPGEPPPPGASKNKRIIALVLTFHSDFQNWGGSPSLIAAGIDVHAVMWLPLFPAFFPEVAQLVTKEPSK